MRAILCRDWGGPERLVLGELPSRPLGPGEVRVAIHAAGINFADTLMIAGQYQERPPLPFAPGLEAAGVVLEVAPDVVPRRVDPGDRVMVVLDHGAFAEEAVVRASDVFPIPDDMDFATAAGFPSPTAPRTWRCGSGHGCCRPRPWWCMAPPAASA